MRLRFWAAKVEPKKVDPVTDPEEEDGDEEARQKRHAFLVLAWLHLLGTTKDRVVQLSDALGDGRLSVPAWAEHFRAELTDAHAEAAVIGRRLAGEAAPISQADHAFGLEAWNDQEEFFAQFVKDIQSGKYGDAGSLAKDAEPGAEVFKSAQVENRSQMYAKRLKGTVTKSFADSLEGDEDVHWILGTKEHCKPHDDYPYDCPTLADGSPYKAEEIPTTPGYCDTPCLFECDCHLEDASGKYSTAGI